MSLARDLRASWVALRHPAFLFSAGNTALAIGQAGSAAIIVNALLVLVLFGIRLNEVRKSKSPGVPFDILVVVNIFTAVSVEINRALGVQGTRLFAEALRHHSFHDLSSAVSLMNLHNLLHTDKVALAAHVSALAYVAWAIGHLYAGWHERRGTVATSAGNNPQFYYGIGDISAVNASGAINPYSAVIMLLGFIRSTLIHHVTKNATHIFAKFVQQYLTAPRLYGLSFIVGAATSLALPHFAIAQVFWALAYFQFK